MGSLCILAGMIVAAQAPSLKKAIALYDDLNDAAAAKQLRALLKTEVPDAVAAKAHVYLGLIELNAIHAKEARDEFKQALTIDPMLDLPGRASPKARLAFAQARHDLQIEMAKPVQPSPAPGPSPGPSPAANPESAPPATPNFDISPQPTWNNEPVPQAETPPPPTAAPVPTPAPVPVPPPPAPVARPSGPPRVLPMALIPPPPPPSEAPLVEEHVKEEPPAPRSHAAAITLGTIALAAGAIAIVGAIEVGNYNSTLSDASHHPGKYTGAQIASKQNTAQIWQISAITLTVVAGLGLTGAVLTW